MLLPVAGLLFALRAMLMMQAILLIQIKGCSEPTSMLNEAGHSTSMDLTVQKRMLQAQLRNLEGQLGFTT
ncbi:hypothetical protein CRM93_02515 [Acetobacter fabarum]|uniref:Uncharacterized protein n=1 Tax=Acetobacter fabarum TaxID=483199 RepID=A0A269Y0A1_9PROT|nr:hypothetical protein B8X00_03100 [Acetobacter fabarum]PEN27949.1 hypothetical protein CRM93_02515 [Acetobacter fabarum]